MDTDTIFTHAKCMLTNDILNKCYQNIIYIIICMTVTVLLLVLNDLIACIINPINNSFLIR